MSLTTSSGYWNPTKAKVAIKVPRPVDTSPKRSSSVFPARMYGIWKSPESSFSSPAKHGN